MVDAKELVDVGFSPPDAEVYLAILRNGASTVAQINKAIPSIHRTNLYEILERLTTKELISQHIFEGTRVYVPHDPDILLLQSREYEQRAQQLVDYFNALVGPQRQPIVQVYTGERGIQTMLNRVLREAKEVRGFNVRFKLIELMPAYAKTYYKENERRRVSHRFIYADNSRLPAVPWLEARILPEDQCGPTQVICFCDVVGFITWHPAMRVLLIEHPAVAQSYAALFEKLWSRAIPANKATRPDDEAMYG